MRKYINYAGLFVMQEIFELHLSPTIAPSCEN